MSNSTTVGSRILVTLGSVAGLITIGGLGHCIGVQSSRATVKQLEADKIALEAKLAEIPEVSSDGKPLQECTGQLAACQQASDRLKAQLAAAHNGPSDPRRPTPSDEPQEPAEEKRGPQLTARLGDVEYRITRAEHTGQELQVWLVATNSGANLETAIYFQSSVTDPSGDSHQQSDRMAGGKRGGLDWLWVTLPHGVPTRFGLAFDSVPPTIDHVPYMRIRMRDQGWLEFRDIRVPYNQD
jgi:hypothetical protein